jgi:hypothetical protein
MRLHQLVLPIVLSAALLTVAGAEDKPTSIAAAAAAVEANMKTREGKAYDEQFIKELGAKYLAVMKDCKEKAGADLRNFDMLVRVEKDGSVKEVLLYPPTKISQWLREPLLKAAFSPPPKPAYWVDIHMIVKRQPQPRHLNSREPFPQCRSGIFPITSSCATCVGGPCLAACVSLLFPGASLSLCSFRCFQGGTLFTRKRRGSQET